MLCLQQQATWVEGAYTLQVRLIRYNNDEHRLSGGECCDVTALIADGSGIGSGYDECSPDGCLSCSCDNRFAFCLRPSDSELDDENAAAASENADPCSLGKVSIANYISNDNFSFAEIKFTTIIEFTGTAWQVN